METSMIFVSLTRFLFDARMTFIKVADDLVILVG